MRLLLTGLLLLAGCATARPSSPCGNVAPVDVIIDSSHFADVVIRDANGIRLGVAAGKRMSRFHYCLYAPTAGRFILDPLAEMGVVVDGGTDPVPGATVLMSIGSDIRISFAQVVLP